MYKLYFSQGTCSLATNVILRELNQPVELIDVTKMSDYHKINPLGTVPALDVGDRLLTEGAAIILYLLDQHANPFMLNDTRARQQMIEDMMFANASVHPAYSKLFFIEDTLAEGEAKAAAMQAAAENVRQLWQQVERKLSEKPFLGGTTPSPADILLTVYASWGKFFSVEIPIGANNRKMIKKVTALPSFQQALLDEQQKAA